MIEVILKEYLESSEALTVPVLTEKPKNKPEKYIVMHRIDAGLNDCVKTCTLSFTCVAPSLYEAVSLGLVLKSLLFLSVSLDTISAAKQGGERTTTAPTERGYEDELIFNFTYFDEVIRRK